MPTKLFISNSHDPRMNLAIEEFLTYSYLSDDPILFFWWNDNTIVCGKNQNVYAEVDLTAAWRDNVTIIRRNTGGGTVYQDSGNRCFSVIVDNKTEQLDYQKALQPIIDFLNQQGIKAEFSGRNDIVVGEYKISGNAQLRTKDKTLIHGTLVYDVDLSKFSKYLTVDVEKIKHQKIKSKSARVKNIKSFYEEMGVEKDVEQFMDELIAYYFSLDEIEPISFSDEEINAIQQLKLNKYDRWEWTFEKNADYEVKKSLYLEHKGIVQTNLTILNGVIKKIKIYGDFLGTQGTEELERRLVDTRLEENALLNVLNQFDLKAIFGPNFTNEDILNVLFK